MSSGTTKGSWQRPVVNQSKFDSNWDAIFGKKKSKDSGELTVFEKNQHGLNEAIEHRISEQE